MRYGFLILFLLILHVKAFPQYDPNKISKKGAALYQQAMEQAQNEAFSKAIDLLEQSIKTDPRFMDAFLSLGGIHLELKNYETAIQFYEKARPIDPTYFHEFRVPYSIALAGLGNFKDALACIDTLQLLGPKSSQLQQQAQQRRKSYQFAVSFEEQQPTQNNFKLNALTEAINSPFAEYFPSTTIDGNELVFTRLVKNYQEDFFISTKENGEWKEAIPLPGKLNSPDNEGASTISQDGEWLIFTGCNFRNGYGSCDLYISFRENNQWTAPYNLGQDINSEFWESAPSLSPDKKHLYFASNRPGGFGGSDIYVSTFDGKKFGKPVNLGPTVNTKGNESCPFIHADNQTLYFTSNGHLGYGGDDIYFTTKIGINRWSTAKNLGYPINTIENEGSLFIEANGKTAYYASSRAEGKGSLDIYTFELPSYAQPTKTYWVKGQVYDSISRKPIPSVVQLYDLSNNQLVNEYNTDAQGKYLMTIPIGKEYAFSVKQKGYLFYSDNYRLSDSTQLEQTKDIPLQPLQINATIHLKNIFFATNEYELLPTSEVELISLYQLLKENSNLKVEVSGHTDNVGSETANQVLSEKRAASVVKYLIEKGIPATQVIYKGYGETSPIADNQTPEGRALNRRTSVKIIQL